MSSYAFYNDSTACHAYGSTTLTSIYTPQPHVPAYPTLISPPPFILSVSKVLNVYTFHFLKTLTQSLEIPVTVNTMATPITLISGVLGYVTLQFQVTDVIQIIFTFHKGFSGNPLSESTFEDGDRYIVTIEIPCPVTPGYSVVFGRVQNISTGNILPPSSVSTTLTLDRGIGSCGCATPSDGDVRVPIINIQGETTLNKSYLSDFTWTVGDRYQYCDNRPDCHKAPKNCDPIYYPFNKLKITTYFQFGPPMQEVVRGKGTTLNEKLQNYYSKHPDQAPTFMGFYELMIRYGMLKYVLARIIYGCFDIKYLCRNFNKTFFKDLKKSRFCGFIEFFENPAEGVVGYDQNFKKCCV